MIQTNKDPQTSVGGSCGILAVTYSHLAYGQLPSATCLPGNDQFIAFLPDRRRLLRLAVSGFTRALMRVVVRVQIINVAS
jgi:hypothetical protein